MASGILRTAEYFRFYVRNLAPETVANLHFLLPGTPTRGSRTVFEILCWRHASASAAFLLSTPAASDHTIFAQFCNFFRGNPRDVLQQVAAMLAEFWRACNFRN